MATNPRYINLRNLVPPYLEDWPEETAVLDTGTVELQNLENEKARQIDNRYYVTSDADGLTRWEQLLGIAKVSDDTEERRQVIDMTYADYPPYSYGYLQKRLEGLLGAGNFEMTMDGYNLTVRINLHKAGLYNEARRLIERIVPLNMQLTVTMLYNTHEQLAAYTHEDLAAYTHGELREAEI